MNPALRALGERAVARVAQPALHVSEGVQVRHEFDADVRAGGIECADLRGRERRRFLPSVLVAGEREGVFDVELQLVDAQGAERADEVEQFRLGRHLAARDVEHEPAHREVGAVCDHQAGQGGWVLRVELPEGLHPVEHAGRVAGPEADAGRRDFQGVAVRREAGARRDLDGAVPASL